MKSFRIILTGSLLIGGTIFYSCNKDFLSHPPQGSLSEPVLSNSAGVDALLIGAYAALDGQDVGNGHGWSSSVRYRFFDLVRWGIAEPTINSVISYESKYVTDIVGAHFTAPKNNYFPIPQTEIDLTTVNGKPTLTQNPGY